MSKYDVRVAVQLKTQITVEANHEELAKERVHTTDTGDSLNILRMCLPLTCTC